jgi:hypothetical protein
MNAAHLHLMFNHVPVMGVLFVVLLLLWANHRQSLELIRAALVTFVSIAVAAGVVYMTGEPAEEVVEGLPGIAEASVEAHEAAALVSLGLAGTLGIFGVFGLWRLHRVARIPRWLPMGSLAGALIVAISMAWTANLGGRIRHPETAGSFVTPQQETSVGSPAARPEPQD